MSEIEYYPKTLDAKRIAISKQTDGEFTESYVLESATECTCKGAIYHQTQCKHMKIRIAWESQGRPQGYYTVSKKGDLHFHNCNLEGTNVES